MIITIDLDDELIAAAMEMTGEMDITALVHLALTALVEREAARRQARLGDSEPQS